MDGPQRFVRWMSDHIANDKKWGRKVFRYHPRSDGHSKRICELVLMDLLAACASLDGHVRDGSVLGGVNVTHQFRNGKRKTFDLAIGRVNRANEAQADGTINVLADLRIACEAKQCMTEHGKSQPRIYDELSSSHEIVHQGEPRAIAAGIVIVNIAETYASPTRQTSGDGPLLVTRHRQPDVTASMIQHLRRLQRRGAAPGVGFDAFAVVVVDCDNVGACRLHTAAPAPQVGDPDHYETFIREISRAYTERFGG